MTEHSRFLETNARNRAFEIVQKKKICFEIKERNRALYQKSSKNPKLYNKEQGLRWQGIDGFAQTRQFLDKGSW